VWLARVTHGVQMLDLEQITDPIFIAKHPAVFRALAEELVAVGVLQAHDCPLCTAA
jgi:hypothetical protein